MGVWSNKGTDVARPAKKLFRPTIVQQLAQTKIIIVHAK